MFPEVSTDILHDFLDDMGLKKTISTIAGDSSSDEPNAIDTTVPATPSVCSTSSADVVDLTRRSLSVPQASAASHKQSSDEYSCAFVNLETTLSHYINQRVDFARQVHYTVDRDNIWRSALTFYKSAQRNKDRLFGVLRVAFAGETGIDAGGLKREYFELLLKELQKEMFEGCECSCLPKKDWELTKQFEIAGLMIAHSILQEGPSFSCLCPAIYWCIVFGSSADLPLNVFPTINDIPLNSATAGLLQFIDEVNIVIAWPLQFYVVCF